MTEEDIEKLENVALLMRIKRMKNELANIIHKLNGLEIGFENNTKLIKPQLERLIEDFSRGLSCGSEEYWQHQLEINGLCEEPQDYRNKQGLNYQLPE
jgi:hypothetical protein